MFRKIGAALSARRMGFASLCAGALLFAGGTRVSFAQSAYAFGYDQNGELGDGGGALRSAPQSVAITSGGNVPVIAVAAGQSHSLALTTDGLVYAWGSNANGQLGDGTTTNRTRAVLVTLEDGSPLTNVIAISGGISHSLALTAGGQVYAWGYNSNGQLGDGTIIQRTHATLVLGLGDAVSVVGVVAIAAGGYHSLALTGDGSVYSWGYNSNGQLGIGSKDYVPHTLPVAIPGLTGITALASGAYHSLALHAGGAVSAWGNNSFGQLSDGTVTTRTAPVAVLSGPNVAAGGVTALAAGVYHTALLAGGIVYGAGYNGYGQIGDGTTLNRSYPVSTTLTGVQTVAAGGYTTLAISAGKSYGWGQNTFGQLGDGTTTNHSLPTASLSVGAVGAIAGGGSHTLLVQAAFAAVSGTLAFEGIAASSSNQDVTFLFVPTDGSTRITRLASVPVSGAFTIPGLPQKSYTVWAKGQKYLAGTAAANASAGNVSGVDMAQSAGDSDNGNTVDANDFAIFIGSYNSSAGIPGSGYDPSADYNGDGSVDATDFGLLVGDYNTVGAPIP